MSPMILNGRDGLSHEIYVAGASHVSEIADLANPVSEEFRLLLWLDAAAYDDVKQLISLAEDLLKWAALSVDCGGDDCEKMHDIFDEVVVRSEVVEPEGRRSYPDHVYEYFGTNWFTGDSLSEVLWNTLHIAIVPDASEMKGAPIFMLVLSPDHERLCAEWPAGMRLWP